MKDDIAKGPKTSAHCGLDQMAWHTELKSHRQRVKGMRPQTDSTNQHGQKMHEVLTVNRQYGKGAELRRLRSEEINTENTVLLDKITRIRTANTFEFFRPGRSRSGFQYPQLVPGTYYNPTTQHKSIDHVNVNLHQSPCSIHYHAHAWPRDKPPTPAKAEEKDAIQRGNSKLLKALVYARTFYGNHDMEKQHLQHTEYAENARRFNGPPEMCFVPAARGGSLPCSPPRTPVGDSKSNSTATELGSVPGTPVSAPVTPTATSASLRRPYSQRMYSVRAAVDAHTAGAAVFKETRQDKQQLLGDRPGVLTALGLRIASSSRSHSRPPTPQPASAFTSGTGLTPTGAAQRTNTYFNSHHAAGIMHTSVSVSTGHSIPLAAGGSCSPARSAPALPTAHHSPTAGHPFSPVTPPALSSILAGCSLPIHPQFAG